MCFVDAAHFVWGASAGWLWCQERTFVRAAAGRQRWNVLRASDAQTQQVYSWSTEDNIDAEQVGIFLTRLALDRAFAQDRRPVTLVLDNARYFHAKSVKALAKLYGIELLFLPSYSPNLNLIERFWKFTKARCLRTRFYDSFSSFSFAIDELIESAHLQFPAELASLLSLNFQKLNPDQLLEHYA